MASFPSSVQSETSWLPMQLNRTFFSSCLVGLTGQVFFSPTPGSSFGFVALFLALGHFLAGFVQPRGSSGDFGVHPEVSKSQWVIQYQSLEGVWIRTVADEPSAWQQSQP